MRNYEALRLSFVLVIIPGQINSMESRNEYTIAQKIINGDVPFAEM